MKQEVAKQRSSSTGSMVVWSIALAVILFSLWASIFEIQQTVRAIGTVTTTSRIQIIQSVDGGVIAEILVSEGDIVNEGQLLVRFDQTRFASQTNEVRARVRALQARVERLRGEVSSTIPNFSREVIEGGEFIDLELSIYESRMENLLSQAAAQEDLLSIVAAEFNILMDLYANGDVSHSEVLSAERAVVETQARLDSIKGEFLEQAAQELAESQDQLAQNLEVLIQREAVLSSSTLVAPVSGQITNIDVSTIGAVIQAGQELMRIVPSDSDLFLEARIAPIDIADVQVGDTASLKFDAFDPSVFGSISGEVTFVSGDVMNEPGPMGQEESVYIAHIRLPPESVTTSIGRTIKLIPGMTAQVDVQAGSRTVLQYLLKPLIKTLSNSLTER